MNIIDFLKDGDLGGRIKSFANLKSWEPWMVFLKAVFALPLTTAEQQIFYECTGRKIPPTTPVEFVCAIIGRRGGKSIVAAFMATFCAVFTDWRKYLAPGEVGHVVVIAQTLKAARVVFGYIRGFFRAIPALEKMIIHETAHEIELSTGIVVSCWPCMYRSTRGLTVVVAIYDEVDFWYQEGPHMAEEVIASIKPAMLTIPGAKEILISTPYTPLGILYKRFQEDWGKDSNDVLIWKAPSLTMNPTLSAEKIAKAVAADPDRAQSSPLDVESYEAPDTFSLWLNGRSRSVPYVRGKTLLECAQAAGLNPAHSCESGFCGSCMAHVGTGQVHMRTHEALSERDIARGVALLCQSVPASSEPLELDADSTSFRTASAVKSSYSKRASQLAAAAVFAFMVAGTFVLRLVH